ncbi:MAG: 3-isopropylmalate dehydratase small subunit [Beijerinckiaceae bacterium]|nr:3-isopropylmalate dehydratase small subunit [Beijerinckiaceae bacterium]
MQPFSIVSGPAAPLMRQDIDTDVIIRIEHVNVPRAELGQWALEPLRAPGFVLDQPMFRGAPILLTGANFGCGSSREHAVWALQGLGIRCVIASSYGDIFFANCFQNGMLPVTLPETAVVSLAEQAARGANVTVDLRQCIVIAPDGTQHAFTLDPVRREMLLEGVDELGLTLRSATQITAWQREDALRRPWAIPNSAGGGSVNTDPLM